MTLSTWLTFLTVCCLGAMSPGPSVVVVLKQTVGNGRCHGFATSWFHAAGIFLWAVATVSGLAVVVESLETLFKTITLCGGPIWRGLV
jgi:threonine/homoserine/homoserine lactone efflux protein